MIRHTKNIDRLFKALLTCKNEEEFYLLFDDLCTVPEVLDMAQRLQTAEMLDEGKNYASITELTGMSTATIGRVSRCLKYGEGGYRMVLDRLKETDQAGQPKTK